MDIDIALLGVAVLVGAWECGSAPALDGGEVPTASSVGMEGENDGSY